MIYKQRRINQYGNDDHTTTHISDISKIALCKFWSYHTYRLKWSRIRSSRMVCGKFPTQRCLVSLTILHQRPHQGNISWMPPYNSNKHYPHAVIFIRSTRFHFRILCLVWRHSTERESREKSARKGCWIVSYLSRQCLDQYRQETDIILKLFFS